MLIHCSIDELIAIRDGEGTAGAKEHLERCDDCMMEMERLYQIAAALKALPVPAVPRDRWPEVRRDVLHARKTDRWAQYSRTALATAAVIALLFVGAKGIVPGLASQPEAQPRIARLMEQSQGLESALRELRPELRVMNGRLAAAVVGLEDDIAVVDSRLSVLRRRTNVSLVDVERLWQQRVNLMNELVRVRATRGTYVGF
ncbi:MAG: hypothetical protein ACE5FJ_05695 [Gemmatimonadales bacterium]